MRTRWGARALIATMAACLLLPAGAFAQAANPAETPSPSTMNVILDLLILRPLGLIVLPVGVAAFIPAALMTGPAALVSDGGKENFQSALKLFVTGPASYVFQRPLGDV